MHLNTVRSNIIHLLKEKHIWMNVSVTCSQCLISTCDLWKCEVKLGLIRISSNPGPLLLVQCVREFKTSLFFFLQF